jgi:hypothetical protein
MPQQSSWQADLGMSSSFAWQVQRLPFWCIQKMGAHEALPGCCVLVAD